MPQTEERPLSICISEQLLTLLTKLDYPRSEGMLASASLIEDEGCYELTGSRHDFETVAGFLAGDANHSPPSRKREQLYEIAEALERALSARARFG